MRESFFTVPVVRCRRRRRDWRSVVLLVAVALVLWLMSSCTVQSPRNGAMEENRLAPVVMGIVALAVVALVVAAVRKVRDDELFFEQLRHRPRLGEFYADEGCFENALPEAVIYEAPTEVFERPADHGLTSADLHSLKIGMGDLWRIVKAQREKAREVLLMIEGAQRGLLDTQIESALRSAHDWQVELVSSLSNLERSLRNTDATQRVPTTGGAA